MTILTASNAATLVAVLSTAKAGDTIYLAAGNYGDVTLSRLNFASDVKITSANSSDPAVFRSLNLSSVSHIALDNIAIDLNPDAKTVSTTTGLRIYQSSSVTLSNSTLVGGEAVNGVPQDTPAGELDSTGNVLGLPTGRGIVVNNSTGIKIVNNDISEFHKGITLGGVDGVEISGNSLNDLRTTPISGGGLNNVVVANNSASNLTPWQPGGAGDHLDFIHFWTSSDQTTASTNFKITGNTFLQGEGSATIGIYLDDNNNAKGFTKVAITENVIYSGNHQAIRLENVKDADVGHNTLLNGPDGTSSDAPQVILTKGATANIHDNILGTTKNGTPEIDAKGNLYLQAFDKSAANYVDKFFFNATEVSSGTAELQLKPGTAASALNVGASASKYTVRADELTALIETGLSTTSKGLVTFSGAASNDQDGLATKQGAKFTWDFGDGTKATGVNATHQFKAAGDYEVVLKVELDGVVDTSKTTIHVADRVLLDIDFAQKAASAVAGKSSSAASTGLHLGVDPVYSLTKFDTSKLFNLDQMDLDFNVKRDAKNAAVGSLLRVHGSWFVSLTAAGEITFEYEDAKSQKYKVTTKGAKITDTLDHAVSLQFDALDHTLSIVVDGREVANAAIGDRLQGMESWGLSVGNPFGSSAAVTIGHVTITDGTPEIAFAAPESPAAVAPVEIAPVAPVVVETKPVAPAPIAETAPSPAPTPTEVVQPPVKAPAIEYTSLLSLDLESLGKGPSGHAGYHLVDNKAYSVSKADSASIFGLEKMELDFDVSRDSTTADVGHLLRVHGSWFVSLTKGGEISFQYTDIAEKTYTVTTKGAGITDTADHNVSIQFDSTQHDLNILVDGKQVADATIGGRLQDAESWGLSVGNPFNSAADVTIGHVVISNGFTL
jgi:carbon monoxide dehydrogenase subunit G